MKTELPKIILAIIAAFSGFGCGGKEESVSKSEPELDVREAAHARMIKELDRVLAETPDNNLYVGDALAREFRAEVAKMAPDAPPADRFDKLMWLGIGELNLGNEREAITHFEKARTLTYGGGLFPQDREKCLIMLAGAYFRLGETENCCAAPSAESCVFPLQGGGLHQKREGAEKAIEILTELLGTPGLSQVRRLEAMWTFNLAAMALGEPERVPESFRFRRLAQLQGASFPKFHNIAADVGLNTFGLAGGVVCDDFDGDGRIDVVTSSWDPAVSLRFFKNLGDGSFEDRSQAANFEGIQGGLNLKQADFDNDGDLDLLVLRGAWLNQHGKHPNSLLENDGSGRFVDITFAVGLGETNFPTQTAEWADFDLDGDLDLYVGNEHAIEQTAPSQLFRNDGPDKSGLFQFTDIAEQAGVQNMLYAKGVSWGDFDGDRYPDLYISNSGEPNRLYRNRGDGTFVDVAAQLGVTKPAQSFPCWFWDFNNDGALDIFAAGYDGGTAMYMAYYMGYPMLDDFLAGFYVNDGRGGFRNQVRELKVDVPMLVMGSNYGDLNNDGYPEFYLGSGTPEYRDVVPNLLFANRIGQSFEDVTIPAGLGHLQKGHGVAFVDFDEDGDLDLFEQMGGALPGDGYYDALYENPGAPKSHWLRVRPKGVESNSFGVGSRIRAVIEESGVERSVYSTVNSGGSFGGNPLTQHLGLGAAETVKRLEIFWPLTGKTQIFESVPADQRIVVTEGKAEWSSD